jgi:hypothetical protein
MPYYNNNASEIQQGMEGNFNPLTGRLNGGNMVLEFLARMAGQKAEQKKLATEDEDRQFELMRRGLEKTQAEQGIAMNQRKIQDYRPPLDPLVELLEGRNVTEKANRQREKEITLRGGQDRLTRAADEKTLKAATTKATADLNKQFLSAKTSVEAAYSSALKEIESKFSADIATLRKPNAKGETQGRTVTTEGSPYLRALQGAHASRKRAKAELEARKAQQLEELERAYSQKLGDVGGQLQSPAPSQTTGGEVYYNPQTGERIQWDGSNWVPIK